MNLANQVANQVMNQVLAEAGQTNVTGKPITLQTPVEVSYRSDLQVRRCKASFETPLGLRELQYFVVWRDRTMNKISVEIPH